MMDTGKQKTLGIYRNVKDFVQVIEFEEPINFTLDQIDDVYDELEKFQGKDYSQMFNNCQHFANQFFALIKDKLKQLGFDFTWRRYKQEMGEKVLITE